MAVDGLGFPLSLSVGFLPYPQVSLWCCALLSQGERYQQHGRTFRKFDGVARGCLSTHPTRRSFVLRLSGPTILIGHAFTVCIRTENQNQASFSPFGPHEISVLIELTLGHLRYRFTDVPPQPNSPSDSVSRVDHPEGLKSRRRGLRLAST